MFTFLPAASAHLFLRVFFIFTSAFLQPIVETVDIVVQCSEFVRPRISCAVRKHGGVEEASTHARTIERYCD